MSEMLEKFAALEHERWSRWHKHMLATMSDERMRRWADLSDTPYSELTEELKQLDRNEVMPYLKYFQANEALIEELVKALEFFSIPHKHCSCQTCIHTHALIAKARSRGGKVNE